MINADFESLETVYPGDEADVDVVAKSDEELCSELDDETDDHE